MKQIILMSTEGVQEVLDQANYNNSMAQICIYIGLIFLIFGMFMTAKGIMLHVRGESSGTLAMGIVLLVMFFACFLGFSAMRQQVYDQYAILAHDYHYTCWYEGKEVDYDTMDVDKYNIELDSAGQMIKFTKPVRRGMGYYFPIVHQ